jgi:hypothetical protein
VVCALAVGLAACSGGGDTGGDAGGAGGAADRAPAATGEAPGPTATSTTVPPAPGEGVRPELRDDPAGLADQLVAAERAVRDPSTGGEALAGWAHLQQVAYRRLAVTPEWDAEVLARVPPELHEAVRSNLDALRQLRQLVTEVRDTVPAWRVVEPPPADVLLAAYRAAEAELGVPWEHLAAVNLVESTMGRIRGTSEAGARGPMQFLPATWAAYGEGDIEDPHDAIRAAARYLADYGGAEGDMAGALYMYNHSDHYVAGVTAIARVMEADEAAFRGYHNWQVYYLTTAGDVWLPTGYQATAPIPVAEYLADHPARGG